MTKKTLLEYPDGELIELEFEEETHKYTVLSPKKYAGKKNGVTTPLSVIAKPALILWSANMTAKYIEDNCRLEDGTFRVSDVELKIAKRHHMTQRDKRADQGTQLHDLIERHIRGEDIIPPEPLEERFQAFLRWEQEVKPEYLIDLLEEPVYSRELDYCGKPDIPAKINGKYGIIDIKSGTPDAQYNATLKKYTGKYRAYPEHYYQCAGYDIAIEEQREMKAEWYMILYLDHLDEGYFQTEDVDYYRDAWRNTLALYNHRKQLRNVNKYQ